MGHHKGGQWVLIMRAYGVAAGGTGNNISAAAAEYRRVIGVAAGSPRRFRKPSRSVQH